MRRDAAILPVVSSTAASLTVAAMAAPAAVRLPVLPDTVAAVFPAANLATMSGTLHSMPRCLARASENGCPYVCLHV